MTNHEASDWDPLPATETGWHPGESNKPTLPAQPVGVPGQGHTVFGPVPAGPDGPPSRGSRRPGLRTAAPMLPAVRIEPGVRSALAVRANEPKGPPRANAADLASLMKVEGPTPTRKASALVGGAPAAAVVTRPRAVPARAPRLAGVDAREQEPWFQAMPVVEQVRLRRAWLEPDAAVASVAGGRSQQLLERFWVAYVVFFVAALPLMLTEGLAGFVRMAMAGCVTGMVWQVVPHTRRLCAASAVAVYVAVAMLPRAPELVAQPFDLLVAVGGAVIVGYLSALGAGHEPRPVEVVEAD